jgi:ADP-ribose pyrophosphatase YjhB (NUDIX family)
MAERLTHAGGVVFRAGRGGPRALLVRARRLPHHWVLPKGHIEARETPEQTAVREVLEETGVEAEIIAPIADDRFVARNKPVFVRYFLMRLLAEGTSSEGRETRWCRADDADGLLGFESTRAIVRRALEMANASDP